MIINCMLDLPLELIYIILKQLDISELINLCNCCKQLLTYQTTYHDDMWKHSVEDLVSYRYNDLSEYNKYNSTKHKSWFDVYVEIKSTMEQISEIKLEEMIIRGNTHCVKLLMDNLIICNYHDSMILACKYGHTHVIDMMLKHDKVNLSEYGNLALITVCERGHVHIVRRLLIDTRINITDGSNLAIIRAKQYGHIDIVNILIDDGRFNQYAHWDNSTWH